MITGYVCVQGDDLLPDMMIGRITGNSSLAINRQINKIVGYEQNGINLKRMLFIADNDDVGFEILNDNFAHSLPPSYTPAKVYLNAYVNGTEAKNAVISNINQGVALVNYVGHGSIPFWATEKLLHTSDIPMLTNSEKLPLVISLSCLNGFFAEPRNSCLADELMLAAPGGAMACFASSGLAYLWEHEILGREIFAALFARQNQTLGTLIIQSKISAYSQGVPEDTLKTFTLFGDPASQLVFSR